MERVFRIEHADGYGICEGANGLCAVYHKNSDHRHGCGVDTCFGKQQDEAGMLIFLSGWKFGFPSLEAVRRWFPRQDGRAAMAAAGGRLVEYEVPELLSDIGNHQVIFDYEAARKVAEHDLAKAE